MSVELKDIIKEENIVYKKTPVLTDNVMHYCPGCSHGVVHKIIAEVIEEMGIQDKTIGVSPVGCSVFAYNYIDIDWAEAAHGRAPAVATAISRLHPEKYVFRVFTLNFFEKNIVFFHRFVFLLKFVVENLLFVRV